LNVTTGDTRPAVVATIGAFDGLHRGHQELLRQVVARAAAIGCASMAVTFDPHPDLVLYPERQLTELSDRWEKQELMQQLGIDHVLIFEFTREFSMLRPDEFIGQLQAEHRLLELWVGSDFALGRGRSGTISALVEIGSAEGFALHVVPPVKVAHEVISSTYIRTLLRQGDVVHAAELLGRPFALWGTVVHGSERGRTIAFPTANLTVPISRSAPANGVYAAAVRLDGERHAAVANLGGRPTFDEHERLVEAHLLDFKGDLYGRRIGVEFLRRLRDVRRFDSIDELRLQIGRDVEAARALPEVAALLAANQGGSC
jgi:riboflavin kinase/FMN adenylyltransferase